MRCRFTSVLCILFGSFLAPSTSAQTAPDTSKLPRVIATVVAEELLRDGFPDAEWLVVEAATPLEAAVTHEMRRIPAFRGPLRDSSLAVRVEVRPLPSHITVRPELHGLPAVLIVTNGCRRSRNWPGGWHAWTNSVYYVFGRSATGWEPVGGASVTSADGSCQPERGRRPKPRTGG
jgi:hypothetical protein